MRRRWRLDISPLDINPNMDNSPRMIDPKKTYVSPFAGLERKQLYAARSPSPGPSETNSSSRALSVRKSDKSRVDRTAPLELNADVAQLGEHLPCKEDDAGSIPAVGSISIVLRSPKPKSERSVDLAALREAVASIPAKKRQNGPKKGFGGRPVKMGAVSKRTMKRRGSRSAKASDAN